jgi:hypothetical protein
MNMHLITEKGDSPSTARLLELISDCQMEDCEVCPALRELIARRERDPVNPRRAPEVEAVAKIIYESMPYDGLAGTSKPAWVEGGNSLKQEEARSRAIETINALAQDSQ